MQVLAETLDQANRAFLNANKAPSRKVGELDTRGSHFYLALYWAQALASQAKDPGLRARFTPVARELEAREATILAELNAAQGKAVAIGGYYHPDRDKTTLAMRPSHTLNRTLDNI